MSTVIRPEISKKSPYYISKHRFYELKHFCLQYPEWVATYNNCKYSRYGSIIYPNSGSGINDIVAETAILQAGCKTKIELINNIAAQTDSALSEYILKAVTEGVSYTYLRTVMNIPCGKDMFYDRYRRFYWLLSEARD